MGQGIGHTAQRGQSHAVVHRLDADVGLVELAHHTGHRPTLTADLAGAGTPELAAVGVVQRFVKEEAVQERGMRRVDADLKRLQPVAAPQAFEGEGVATGGTEAIERGQGRGRAAFVAQPGEQDAAALDQGVVALPHVLAQRAAGGLGRGFEAVTFDVELPAVEGAAQAVAFMAAISQVGATVRAVAVQQAELALGVFEQDQVLAEQPHRLDRTHGHARVQVGVELVHQRHRLPVVAHQLATRGAGADAGDALVQVCFHGDSSKLTICSRVARPLPA